MTLVEINWRPTDRQLRQFGAICLVGLPLVAWVWGAHWQVIGGLAAAGLALAAAGWAAPQSLKWVFLGLTVLAAPIGMVIGELALLLIFFAVFLPIGLALRWTKGDPLQLKLDRQADTYWQPKPPPKNVASYYRQS